jgi:hypothetical protein
LALLGCSGVACAPGVAGIPTRIPDKAPAVPAGAKEARIVVETFDSYDVGSWPKGWVGGDDEDEHKKAQARGMWKIGEEDGNRFAYLAYDQPSGNALAKQIENWSIKKYPILEWRWRVRKLPPGGEEHGKANDSAAQVVVLFKRNMFSWRTLRQYETARAKHKFIVKESGPEKANTWQTERTNVLEDYRKAFGADEDPPNVFAVFFRSDSDDTRDLIGALKPDETVFGVPTGASYDDLVLIKPLKAP